MADHSIRSFLFARLLAEHEGSVCDDGYDERLLFAACVLHDLGLGSLAAGEARFEVEGADAARAFVTEQGVAPADAERVWEAIALHSSLGLADRFGLLTYLTHKGVFTDGGRFTTYPRTIFARSARPTLDRSATTPSEPRSSRTPPAPRRLPRRSRSRPSSYVRIANGNEARHGQPHVLRHVVGREGVCRNWTLRRTTRRAVRPIA